MADAAQDLTPVFELGGELGRGAFGAVCRARERATGREVALKLLLADRDARAFERFLREAAVAATLDHPGIVRVHASGLYSGRPCIVYELVEGAPLGQVVARLDHRRRVELVRDAALAVGHAHAHDVVHRDLKPDNLLVDGDGRMRVTDFGLALLEGADRLTRTGGMSGTPTHMAPEQFAGKGQRIGPQADVWALGVVLYEALTGRLPFEGASLISLASAIEAGRMEAPRSIDPTISRALEAVCLRALQRDPAARPADGTAFARELDQALASRGGVPLALVLVPALALALALLLVLVLALRDPDPAPAVIVDAPVVTPDRPVATTTTTRAPVAAPLELRLATEESPKRRWAFFVTEDRVLTGGPADDVRLWSASGDLVRRWSLRVHLVARRTPGSVLVVSSTHELLELDVDVAVPVRRAEPGPSADMACGGPQGPLAFVKQGAVELRDVSGTTVTDVVACDRPNRVAFSDGGASLAVSTGDGEDGKPAMSALVYLWDVADGRATRQRTVGLPGKPKAMCFSPDGQRLFVGTTSQQLVAIDVALGQFDYSFEPKDTTSVTSMAHGGSVYAIAVSPDGRRLYSSALLLSDGSQLELKAWDVAARTEVATAVMLRGEPKAMDVSPDGARLLVATAGAGVYVRQAGKP